MSSGYWSSGTRLGDSSRVEGQGIEPGDLPEYMVCPFFHAHSFLPLSYLNGSCSAEGLTVVNARPP